MGSFGAGFSGDGGCPVFTLPVDAVARSLAHAFPPHIAVVGQRHIGEDHVLVQAGHAVGVGQGVGAWGDAKVTRLGVDGAQSAVRAGLDPGDVVTNGGDLPAWHTRGWNQHGEVGLAASAGEGGGHMVFFSFRVGHAQNQHVLGQPTLVSSHVRGNTQRKAFLAKKRVAAIARAVGPNFPSFWVVHDVLGLVARPADIFIVRFQGRAHGVNARYEFAVGSQHLIHRFAHAGHDLHIHCHIGAVGEFDANVGNRAAQRAHGERHHIKGATCHAAVKQWLQGLAHLVRRHPVVGRTGVFLVLGTNEGAVFHTGHVRGVGAGQKRVGALGRVELFEGARLNQ